MKQFFTGNVAIQKNRTKTSLAALTVLALFLSFFYFSGTKLKKN